MKAFLTVVQAAIVSAVATVAMAAPTSTSEPMDFRTCVASIDAVANKLGMSPTVIVDTAIMKMVRFHTGDGSLLVTCSKPDRKRIFTESSRR